MFGVIDMDECAINTTICDEFPNTVCNNTVGSYKCDCKSGFYILENDDEDECIGKKKLFQE